MEIDTLTLSIMCVLIVVMAVLLIIFVLKTRKQIMELEDARVQAKKAMLEARTAGDEALRARQEADRARSEAEAANRAKSEFLSSVSHNIRTPLNAIIGMTEIAETHTEDLARMVDCLQKIERSGRHLLSVVNDVLDISHIENGKFTLHVKPVSLRETMEAAWDMIRTDLELKHQTMELKTDDLLAEYVYCDGGRLEQVLLNLLSNAVKYTPEGGSVILSLSQNASHKGKDYIQNCFQVKDNGIGMSEEFQKDLFHTVSNDPEEKHHVYQVQGPGLGLPLAKYIIDAMEGTLDVESEPDKGTAFFVTVDFEAVQEEKDRALAEKQAQADEDSYERSDVWLEGLSILLAEDNEINAELACTILEEKGAFVEVAENGKTAHDKFEASSEGYYDLILMDLRMPVMNGLEATKAIRALERADAATIPIIAMTADAFNEDVQNCLEAGMNGHISKPVDVPKLTKTLVKYLRFLS